MQKKFSYPLLTSLLFAGSIVAAKYTTLELKPITTTLIRYVIALVFLSLLLMRYKSSLSVEKNAIIPLILSGLFGIVGYHYFFFASLRYTEIANTAIINALGPIVTAVAARILIQEDLRGKNYLGVTFAVTGVIILVAKGNIHNILALQFNRGDLLMLLAVLSWAGYSLLIKKLTIKYDSFMLAYYASLFGVMLLIPLAVGDGFGEQLETISWTSIFSLLYMGIFASAIGFILYNSSINEIGPTRTSSLVHSLVPILVALFAWIFFSETITAVMILSTLLIIVGLHFMLVKH